MFPEKHVRVSEKSRTCFSGNTYVFLKKVVHVFRETRTCFFRIIRSGTKAYMNLYNKPPLSSDLKMNVWMRF